MEVLGRIMRTSGGQAQVAIVRDTACGHSCTSCGACQNRELYIQAENPAQYPVGDMVYVEVPDKPPYKIAFVVIYPAAFAYFRSVRAIWDCVRRRHRLARIRYRNRRVVCCHARYESEGGAAEDGRRDRPPG